MAWKNFKRRLRYRFYGQQEQQRLRYKRLVQLFRHKYRGRKRVKKALKPVTMRLLSMQPSLIRSYWFNRFINVFIYKGKKGTTLKFLFRALLLLKTNYGRTPVILLFEILETYRVPFRVIKARRAKRLNRVHLITWWKQYAQVLKWFRSALRRKSVRAVITWDLHLLTEIELLLLNSSSSQIYQKKALWLQLAAMGRISSHYRWKFRPRSKALL